MPCYDSRDDDDRGETRERLDRATRVACELASYVRSDFLWRKLSTEAKQWIHEHDEMDKQRRLEEEVLQAERRRKERALSKLTAKERKLLGL